MHMNLWRNTRQLWLLSIVVYITLLVLTLYRFRDKEKKSHLNGHSHTQKRDYTHSSAVLHCSGMMFQPSVSITEMEVSTASLWWYTWLSFTPWLINTCVLDTEECMSIYVYHYLKFNILSHLYSRPDAKIK